MRRILQVTTLDITIRSFLIPHLRALQKEGYEVEVACGGGKFFKEIQDKGFKVHFIPFNRRFYHYSNIKALFQILKILRQNQYDILHTHTPIASFISRIVAKWVGVPMVIYTVHGFHFHEYGSKLSNVYYYLLERLAGRFTDIFIVINTDDYKIAKKMFLDKKVFYIKGVGINTKKFKPENVSPQKLMDLRSELQIDKDEKVIGLIAEMSPRKRHIDLLYAASLILKKRQDIKFLFIGEGQLMNYCQSLSKRLNIDKHCIFVGFRNDIKELLSLMDIFIFPSIREGLPVSLMEAMSMERPIVATNIRGNRDLVVNGITGRLVPVKDPKKIAEAVDEILSDDKMAERMGKNARKMIEEGFDERVIIPKLLKIYK